MREVIFIIVNEFFLLLRLHKKTNIDQRPGIRKMKWSSMRRGKNAKFKPILRVEMLKIYYSLIEMQRCISIFEALVSLNLHMVLAIFLFHSEFLDFEITIIHLFWIQLPGIVCHQIDSSKPNTHKYNVGYVVPVLVIIWHCFYALHRKGIENLERHRVY